MKLKFAVLFAVLFSAGVGVAQAAPGPEEACLALSERAREAVGLKKKAVPVNKAVAAQSSEPVPEGVPSAQHTFHKEKLPGVIRLAYMAGMSADGSAQFYLKQCRQGS